MWTADMDSGLEIDVEQGTEGEEKCRQHIDRKEIRTGMHIPAAQDYKKNMDSPVGEELDLFQARGYYSLLNGARGKQTLVAGGGWDMCQWHIS